MIITTPFIENNYPGYYQDDDYDYLFKRRTKKERKHRKEKETEANQQEEDAEGNKLKHPLLSNFGLLHRKKKKTTSGSDSDKKKSDTSEAAIKNKTEENKTKENESAETGADAAKLESKDEDKNAKPKEAGFGPALGFTFLGITILLVGVALYKADKKSNPPAQVLKVAA